MSKQGHSASNCLALVLDDVLTLEECDILIAGGKKTGFQYIRQAKHMIDGKEYSIPIQNPREYKVAVFNDDDQTVKLSDLLWNRINARISKPIKQFADRDGYGAALGVNQRLRVLHYSNNDHFVPHFDLVVADDDHSTHSLLTVLVYLNNGNGSDFSGGETLFLNQQNVEIAVGVKPRAGRVVVFEHELFHCGSPLVPISDNRSKYAGSKYVMRTDVMFNIAKVMEGGGVRSKDEGTDFSSVSEMLDKVGLSHLNSALSEQGLLGTMEAFRAAGEVAIDAILTETMLEDTAIDVEHIKLIVEAAFHRNR